MFDLFKQASALRARLAAAEKLSQQQRAVADEIASQRDKALNKAGAAEAKLKDVERELEAAREDLAKARDTALEAEQAAQSIQQAKDTLAAQLAAKAEELKVLADVQAKAEGWEKVAVDLRTMLRDVADAAGVGPGDDLIEVVRTHKSALDRLQIILGDVEEELRDAAGSPTVDGDAGLQAPAEAISVGDAPAPAETAELIGFDVGVGQDVTAYVVVDESRAVVEFGEAKLEELAHIEPAQASEAEARA